MGSFESMSFISKIQSSYISRIMFNPSIFQPSYISRIIFHHSMWLYHPSYCERTWQESRGPLSCQKGKRTRKKRWFWRPIFLLQFSYRMTFHKGKPEKRLGSLSCGTTKVLINIDYSGWLTPQRSISLWIIAQTFFHDPTKLCRRISNQIVS